MKPILRPVPDRAETLSEQVARLKRETDAAAAANLTDLMIGLDFAASRLVEVMNSSAYAPGIRNEARILHDSIDARVRGMRSILERGQ